MNQTKIAWTTLSWNPVSGCTKVSPGCRHCYAETFAERHRGGPGFPFGFDITLRPHKLVEPKRVKVPSLIFVNSMSDLFHEAIPDEYRDRVLDVMRDQHLHRYQVLTKRPEVARRYFERREAPRSMWLGVSVESSAYLGRMDVLRDIDAVVRFVSAEPLLGPLLPGLCLHDIHWVITGGESGQHLRDEAVARARSLADLTFGPIGERVVWVRDIRDACVRDGAAFFHKQWGGVRPDQWGRELDGKVWDEMPWNLSGAMPGT